MPDDLRPHLREVRRSSRVQRNEARRLSIRAQQQRIQAMLGVMAARERLELAAGHRDDPR